MLGLLIDIVNRKTYSFFVVKYITFTLVAYLMFIFADTGSVISVEASSVSSGDSPISAIVGLWILFELSVIRTILLFY